MESLCEIGAICVMSFRADQHYLRYLRAHRTLMALIEQMTADYPR